MENLVQDQSINQPSRVSSGVSFGKPARKRSRQRPWKTLALIAVLVIGLAAALLASQTNLDLRQFAWGGVRFGSGIFQQGFNPDVGSIAVLAESESGQKKLFHSFTQTYWDADVVNIVLPEFAFEGVAFQAYDELLNTTFVFARLANIPYIEGRVIKVWLEAGDGNYLAAGLPDLVIENGQLVAYIAVPIEGRIDNYQTLHVSSDELIKQLRPSQIFLSVDFEEGS